MGSALSNPTNSPSGDGNYIKYLRPRVEKCALCPTLPIPRQGTETFHKFRTLRLARSYQALSNPTNSPSGDGNLSSGSPSPSPRLNMASNPTNSPSGDGNKFNISPLLGVTLYSVQPYQFPVRGRKLKIFFLLFALLILMSNPTNSPSGDGNSPPPIYRDSSRVLSGESNPTNSPSGDGNIMLTKL